MENCNFCCQRHFVKEYHDFIQKKSFLRTDIIDLIRKSIIGDNILIPAAFGARRLTYADYTASGRSLSFFEDFIRDQVLPFYANSHTESSLTGLQTTHFREEARLLISKSVGADPEKDVLVFVGSGATGAINKLATVLGIMLPKELSERYGFLERIPEEDRPVVFIGPYEHHSNELPWRESIADVVRINADPNGHIDIEQLRDELPKYAARRRIIGSFSAASNVTGIVSATHEISELLHSVGGVVFWDFAAAGPYVRIEMNPEGRPDAHKDAVFLSPHKFIGGPGTPGVLVAKKALFRNKVPAEPGGGTVRFVDQVGHEYLAAIDHREEGGTPNIVGAIRAGLVFQLKDELLESIEALEDFFISRAVCFWSKVPGLQVLGSHCARRLSIVSFTVKYDAARGSKLFLHHNFVVALLNDLFGIQARGGCSCAGPYGMTLLQITKQEADDLHRVVDDGWDGIKPGWSRLNFNFFITPDVFSILLRAVNFVARCGWRLLPLYQVDPRTGLWNFRQDDAKMLEFLKLQEAPPGASARPSTLASLHQIVYREGKMGFLEGCCKRIQTAEESAMEDYFVHADNLVRRTKDWARYCHENQVIPKDCTEELAENAEAMRWFALPSEAAKRILE